MAQKKFFTDTPTLQQSTAARRLFNMDKDKPERERKSRRVNLLLKPSVVSDAGKIAIMRRVSFNELIGQVLEQYISDNQDTLNKYNTTFTEEKE